MEPFVVGGITFILLMLIVVPLVVVERSAGRSVEARMSRLERRVDQLARNAGLQEPVDPQTAELIGLVRSGQKIEAIKRYRKLTGSGLAEAKAAIDQLA